MMRARFPRSLWRRHMTEIAQELMTPHETARWFRRSPSWLRQQSELLKLGGAHGQPLYHTRVCRAYVYAKLCELTGESLRRAQLAALAAACGLGGASESGGRVSGG